ncbi:MAG: hypothetical protein JO010_04560 [Alphaproteobacteria bacterium]|nr:hypothetical protein [Alphaproteobacteria bacterium]
MARFLRIVFALWMSACGLLMAVVLATVAFDHPMGLRIGSSMLRLAELCLGSFGLLAVCVSGAGWMLMTTMRPSRR